MDAWRWDVSFLAIAISLTINVWEITQLRTNGVPDRRYWIRLTLGGFLGLVGIYSVPLYIPEIVKDFFWLLWLFSLFVVVFYDDIIRSRIGNKANRNGKGLAD